MYPYFVTLLCFINEPAVSVLSTNILKEPYLLNFIKLSQLASKVASVQSGPILLLKLCKTMQHKIL